MKERLKNNLGLKMLAFLFAFLLWFMVVNIDDPVKTKTYQDIPVLIEHEEYITTKDLKTYQIVDNTQVVDVTISARRSSLSKIDEKDIVAIADMRELYLESMVPIKISVPEHTIESAEANPRNMRIKIEDNASATFPITPIATGTLRDGYVLGDLKADPERVTLNGPVSVIERISRVVAEVDVSGMSQNMSLESALTLYDAENNIIDQSLLGNNLGKIGVSVEVELYKAKSVDISVDTSNIVVGEGYSLAEVSVSPKEIQVAGPRDRLVEVDEIFIPAEALAGEPIIKRTEILVDISEYLPEEIQLVDESGANILITVSVEKDGTKNYNLPVGSISVQNLNNKFKMAYEITDDIEVNIRGPKVALMSFDINQAASINLTGYSKAGVYVVPVIIDLPANCILEQELSVRVVLTEKE